MSKLYSLPSVRQTAGNRRLRVPLTALFLSATVLSGFYSQAQSPGGVSPVVWYRADAPGTLFSDAGTTQSTDSTTVYQWNEYTGTGYNLIQAAAGNRPLFSNAKTLVNFNPTVTFNNDYMGFQPAAGVNIIDRADGTLYAAGYTNTLGNCGFFGFDESNDYPGLHIYGSQHNLLFFTGGPGYQGVSANAFTNKAYFVAGGSWQNGGGASAAYASATASLNGNRTNYTGNQLQNAVLDNNARDIRIGWDNNYGALDGQLNELIVFENKLNSNQMDQVESYMAIKYGTTYANGSKDYKNSTGGTVWTAATNSGYSNNIAGIARDDNGALYQKQSWSVNTGRQVLISTTGLASTNATNTGTLTNGQALIWGDNGLAKMPTVAVTNIPGTNYRFASVWKVQNTGSVGTVRIAWPSVWASLKLVQSSDPTFATGNTITDMTGNTQTINSIMYNYADVTLTDGQYFTFAAYVQFPGGIASFPAVWYRPDNASSSKWKDASPNGIDLTSVNGNTVNSGNQAHNFHNWTTGYSSTKYYSDTATKSSVFGTWGDGGITTTASNDYSGGYYYMPLTVFGVARDTLATGGSGLITGVDNDQGYGAEPGFGVYGGDQRFYRYGNGAAVSGSDAPINSSAVYMWQPPAGGSTTTGTDTLLMGLNGLYNRTQISPRSSVAGPHINIGTDNFAYGTFPGDIQEVIWYKDSLGYNDIQKVETYLALKYGTTLAHNYIAASGTTIYDLSTDSTYRYNIAGIGRENANGGLNQRQSNSVHTGNQVLISTTGLSNTNDSNAVQLTDGQYLVWGDNGLTKTPAVYMPGMSTVNVRFKSIWKVQNTGSVGTVRVAWPATELNNFSLIQSADTVFDATDAITDMSTNTQTVNGVTYNYADVTLSNGQYFTFTGHIAHAPGGVFAGLSYWYRADKDVVNTGDSTNVTSWTDYAMGTVAGQVGTNSYPLYRVGNAAYFNFNPGISFTDGSQSIGNLLAQAVADTAYDIFTLTKEGITAGGANARVFSVLANKSLTTGNIHYWDGIGVNYDGRLERYNTTSGLAYLANPGNIDFPSNSPGIMYHTFTNNTVAKGLNGAPKGTTSVSGPYRMIDGGFIFGSTVFSGNGSDNYSFKGNLGETIIYGSNNLTPVDRNKVDAYLAIKYGVTLDTSRSYLSSGSVIVWDKTANKPHYNNVAGIGRDDLSALFQKQSRSQITNNPNNQITMGLGDIYSTNLANTDSIADGQFLVWGDNGNTQAMTNVATSYIAFTYNSNSNNRRMKRTWKVQNTGVASALKIRFPVASVGTTTLPDESCAQYVILFADDTAFTSNVTAGALTINGTNYDAIHNFPNGASYFTFARLSSFTPGVVYLPDTTEATNEVSPCTSGTWTYFHKTGDTSRKVLATSGLTPAQVSNLMITVTPEGAAYNNGTRITKLMSRITTVADASNGTYAGAKVRVYYSSAELAAAQVPGALTQGWFLYNSYNADTIKTDIQTDGVFNPGKAVALTPSTSGMEDGVPYVEFLNASPFASFVYVSSTENVGTVLPVTFLDFTATKQGAAVVLRWATASESGNKGFSMERSADSKAWHSIGFVNSLAPNGNSNWKLEYAYTDKIPVRGTNYYRLKQTDLDGKYKYSVVRQVSFNSDDISIHPNPTSNYIAIDGLSGGESIKVYDAAGRMIKEIKPVQASLTIDLDGWNNGLYHIHITGDNGTIVSRKVIKVN